MAGATLYNNALLDAYSKLVDWSSDTIKLQLHTNAYTPAGTHHFQADLSNEVVAGGGYSTGGVTLGSKTRTVTAANSWGTARANSTAYAVGDVVRPSTGNGHLYVCVVAGTSAGSAPTFSTVSGQDTTDGSVTWSEAGTAIFQLGSAAASWTSSTITARYAVFVDTTPGSSASNPLIGWIDFGSDVATTSSTFTVNPGTLGWFYELLN